MSWQKIEEKVRSLKSKLHSKDEKIHIAESEGIKIVADLISGLIVGAGLGYIVDKFFYTKPLFLIIFMIFGFFIGLYVFYRDLTKKK